MGLQKLFDKLYKLRVYATFKAKGKVSYFGGNKEAYGVYALQEQHMPEDLVVVSVGIGTDSSFEQDILGRFAGGRIYAFDPTPMSIDYVRTQYETESRFRFFPYGLAGKDGKAIFYLPRDKDHAVSCSLLQNNHFSQEEIEVDVKNFFSLLQICGETKIDVLKMDIEGTEFEVIDDILDYTPRVTQICLETHQFLFNNRYIKIKNFVGKMLKYGYKIAHISRHGLGDEWTFVYDTI